MTAARQKTSFFSARYKRVRARRGHRRALVALAPTILELCWHLLTTDQPYHDHYDKRRPGPAIKPCRRFQIFVEDLNLIVSPYGEDAPVDVLRFR